LLGEPTFFPHATEAVWMLVGDRSVYVVEHADGAGNSVVTISSTIPLGGGRTIITWTGAC
jgi:N12 class adenine-specific DNA methylase